MTRASHAIAATAAAPNASGLRADALRERLALLGLSAPALLLVLLTMIAPVGWLFWLSFLADDGSLSLVHYQRMLEQPSYARIFRMTFEVSLITTALCILLGYPLAYVLSQLPRRAANLCMIAVLLPFWTSLLVRTYAWLVLLQRRGIINTALIKWGVIDSPLALVHNFTGTAIGMLHIMLPFLVLPLYANMRALDRDYIRAAASLGASPVSAFWRVYLPLTVPGLTAGTVMVFVLCLGFYITPQFLGGGRVTTISMKIQQNVATYFDWGAASSLGVVLFVLTMLIFWMASRLFPVGKITGQD